MDDLSTIQEWLRITWKYKMRNIQEPQVSVSQKPPPNNPPPDQIEVVYYNL